MNQIGLPVSDRVKYICKSSRLLEDSKYCWIKAENTCALFVQTTEDELDLSCIGRSELQAINGITIELKSASLLTFWFAMGRFHVKASPLTNPTVTMIHIIWIECF